MKDITKYAITEGDVTTFVEIASGGGFSHALMVYFHGKGLLAEDFAGPIPAELMKMVDIQYYSVWKMGK